MTRMMLRTGGRSYGKSAEHRAFIRRQLADEGHVHVASADGLWCVTATAIGPLWRKVRQPCPDGRPYDSAGSVYRQMQQEAGRLVIYDELAQWEKASTP